MSLTSLKIDEVYNAKITGLENDGAGVTKINGMVVFVPKALMDEEVSLRITEVKKSFARAKLIKIIKASSKRQSSDCPYYEECGGCNLRHLSYEDALKFKKEKIETALWKIGKVNVSVDDVRPSFKINNYRNKASFKLEGKKIGFYEEGTYQLVDIDTCKLLNPKINDALKVIRNYIKENDISIKTITIKYGNALDEILIDIYSTDADDVKICDYLTHHVNNLKTVLFNDKVVFGDGYVKEVLNGLMFSCSSKSFFQVNSDVAEKLYEKALELAGLDKKDTVLDLYCGTGTISLIASSYVKKVIGVEIVEDAINDAKKNMVLNNINNVKFICGDVKKELVKIDNKIDKVFVDPPRGGMDRSVIAILKKLASSKIVYISCDPVTLARDLNYLSDSYDVVKVAPFDMFPNTSHVETVVMLKLKDK